MYTSLVERVPGGCPARAARRWAAGAGAGGASRARPRPPRPPRRPLPADSPPSGAVFVPQPATHTLHTG